MSEHLMALADALHAYGGDLAIEGTMCWCRRIATVDGDHDGPIDANWSTTSTYVVAEWGVSAERPTYCEQSARKILDFIAEREHD
jgi:hypothetical protein